MVSKETRKRGPAYYYTVYDRCDEVVAFGTAGAVCEKLGIRPATLYSRVSRNKSLTEKEKVIHIVKERLKGDDDLDSTVLM